MVTGHYFSKDNLSQMPMSNFTDVLAGGAALKSTSKDLSKFVQANMELIETPLRKGMDLSHKQFFPGQGLGWRITKTMNNKEVIWHNGAWFPSGFCGFIGFDKNNKNGLVILSNQINYYEEIAPAGIQIIMNM